MYLTWSLCPSRMESIDLLSEHKLTLWLAFTSRVCQKWHLEFQSLGFKMPGSFWLILPSIWLSCQKRLLWKWGGYSWGLAGKWVDPAPLQRCSMERSEWGCFRGSGQRNTTDAEGNEPPSVSTVSTGLIFLKCSAYYVASLVKIF